MAVDRRLVEAAALLHDVDKVLPPDDPARGLPHGDGLGGLADAARAPGARAGRRRTTRSRSCSTGSTTADGPRSRRARSGSWRTPTSARASGSSRWTQRFVSWRRRYPPIDTGGDRRVAAPERGGPADGPGARRAPGGRRLPRRRDRPGRGPPAGVDRGCAPGRADREDRRVTTSPLAYFWGDDDFAMGRAVDRLAAALAAEGGVPLERWDLRGAAERRRRPARPAPGADRDARDVRRRDAGGRLERRRPDGQQRRPRRGPRGGRDPRARERARDPRRDEVGREGAVARRRSPRRSPRPGGTSASSSPRRRQQPHGLDRSARRHDRGIALGAGRRERAGDRVGGFVLQNDAERPFQTRTASSELDKLALYRGSAPITVDDVRALVAEAVPGTVWGFVDAVARAEDRARPWRSSRTWSTTTPEPVLLVMLHRRVRAAARDRRPRRERRDACRRSARRSGSRASTGCGRYAGQARELDDRRADGRARRARWSSTRW